MADLPYRARFIREHERLVRVHDAICRKGQPDSHDFEGCAIDGIESLKDYADGAEKREKLLAQVALEALRLVYHDDGDRCSECGLIGHGALRDALTKAFGREPWKLIWGNDANVDAEAWDEALQKQTERGEEG